jgi:RND family efflux transporter MFP subunit
LKKILVLLIALLLFSCAEEPTKQDETIYRNIRVVSVSSEEHMDYETYVGHVTTSGIVQHSFQASGELLEILVEEGDTVTEGQLLARLNPETFEFQYEVAEAELNAAKAQYAKALEGLDYAKNNFNRITDLFQQGVSSQFDYDQAKLNYNIASDDVTSAREMRNQAETNIKVKTLMLENTSLYASKDGIVMTVLNEATELISQGYPVVILRDINAQVAFGLPQKDTEFIKIGDTVLIDNQYSGRISSIGQIPDKTTQTYEVLVEYDGNHNVGEILEVKIDTTKVEGTKIPLGAIRSDGEDYVFILENDLAIKVPIEVVIVLNQEVVVNGLPDEAQIIIEGIMNLESGDKVQVVE